MGVHLVVALGGPGTPAGQRSPSFGQQEGARVQAEAVQTNTVQAGTVLAGHRYEATTLRGDDFERTPS